MTVDSGKSVVWENRETIPHQVVADDGAFTSPVLGPGETFSFTFRVPGVYGYADGVWGKYRGTVTVRGASRSVTLDAGRATVVYGRPVLLSGTVSRGRAGEEVTVLAKRFGSATFGEIATVRTGAAGSWSFAAKPAITTSFRARWSEGTSQTVVVGVRPRVTLSQRRGGVFSTTVTAARSFAGRYVVFQRRRAATGWVSVMKTRLGESGAILRPRLPRGSSLVRIVLPWRQARPGYLAGVSRQLPVRG